MYHPDINSSLEAEELFKEINKAASVLLDDEEQTHGHKQRRDDVKPCYFCSFLHVLFGFAYETFSVFNDEDGHNGEQQGAQCTYGDHHPTYRESLLVGREGLSNDVGLGEVGIVETQVLLVVFLDNGIGVGFGDDLGFQVNSIGTILFKVLLELIGLVGTVDETTRNFSELA